MRTPQLTRKTHLAIACVVFSISIITFFRSNLFCSQVHAACTADRLPNSASTLIAPQYYTYSDQILAESLKSGKKVVLYFHAPWCTTCSSFDLELRDPQNHLPEDMIVLQIPYDTATELKNRYHVNYQHTLVLLNQAGEVKEMWVGGDLQSLLKYMVKYSS